MKRERKIKLQEKYRHLDSGRGYRIVPELRVSGDWLAAVGFEAGGIVKIEISENQLKIKMNDDEN